jgi:2-polyprenyl-3-methyl-5-hydroxy-6-metoxy-1,4-benzoquinol methylase
MVLHRNPWQRTDQMRKGKQMSNEEKGPMSQRSFWSASETAERGPQDVGRRRLDFAEATQRMLEAAGLGPGDHALDSAAGTGDQSILAARMVEPGGSILATDISEEMLVAHVRAVAWSLLRAFRATTIRDFRDASREALAGYYRKNLLGVKAGQQTETESENGAR